MKHFFALAPAALLVLLTGCGDCIDVPATDTTRPSATVTLIFKDPADPAHERTLSVSSTNPLAVNSISLPIHWEFQVFYFASDDGGVRTLTATQAYTSSQSGSDGQPLIAVPNIPTGDFNSCAKTYRALSFDWQVLENQEFTVNATDFRGNASGTAKVIVNHD